MKKTYCTLALLLGACTSNESELAEINTTLEASAAILEATCTWVERCAPRAFDGIPFASEADCKHHLTKQLTGFKEPFYEFDKERLNACLDISQNAECDIDLSQAPACQNIFRGTIADGECCDSNEGCQLSSICNQETRVCEKVSSGIGETCNWDIECLIVDGFCSAAKVCERQQGRGASCNKDTACEWGLACNDGRCGDRKTIGESCRLDQHCASDLCVIANCMEPECEGTCSSPANENETCGLRFEGPLDDCAVGFYCEVTDDTNRGRCQPWRQRGETCALDRSANNGCLHGLNCIDGVCANPNAGETCNHYARCGDDANIACDSQSNTCQPTKSAGSVCETNHECESGLVCFGGRCSPNAQCNR